MQTLPFFTQVADQLAIYLQKHNKVTEDLNIVLLRKVSYKWQDGGLEPRTSGLQHQCPKPPSHTLSTVIIFIYLLFFLYDVYDRRLEVGEQGHWKDTNIKVSGEIVGKVSVPSISFSHSSYRWHAVCLGFQGTRDEKGKV